jgi:dephospho-CoA kinase
MISVALTGNIASGKSTVLELFRGWGAFVTDADAIVHRLQQPGTPVFTAIVRRFGSGVVASDGSLDRAALRQVVFRDPKARTDLEHIVHPAVRALRSELEQEARTSNAAVAVHDIPLLFESADPTEFDRVVLVEAPSARRREWLVERRGLSPDEADRMLSAQMASELKRDRSHFVIRNDSDLATLEHRARQVWDRLVAEAARCA